MKDEMTHGALGPAARSILGAYEPFALLAEKLGISAKHIYKLASDGQDGVRLEFVVIPGFGRCSTAEAVIAFGKALAAARAERREARNRPQPPRRKTLRDQLAGSVS